MLACTSRCIEKPLLTVLCVMSRITSAAYCFGHSFQELQRVYSSRALLIASAVFFSSAESKRPEGDDVASQSVMGAALGASRIDTGCDANQWNPGGELSFGNNNTWDTRQTLPAFVGSLELYVR